MDMFFPKANSSGSTIETDKRIHGKLEFVEENLVSVQADSWNSN